MAKRMQELIDKYKGKKWEYPLLSSSEKTLLNLPGVNIPMMTPLKLVNYYLNNNVGLKESNVEILNDAIMNIIAINTKSKTKSKPKSKTKSKPRSKTLKKNTPNPIESPTLAKMTPSGALIYAWKKRK